MKEEATKRMKLKTAIRAAVVAAGVAVAGLGLAAPASADTYCGTTCSANTSGLIIFTHVHYQAQVDNNYTYSGVSSWLWMWNDYYGDHTDYYLSGEQNMHTWYIGAKSSASIDLPKDVTKFRVCGPNGFGGDNCSDWHHLS